MTPLAVFDRMVRGLFGGPCCRDEPCFATCVFHGFDICHGSPRRTSWRWLDLVVLFQNIAAPSPRNGCREVFRAAIELQRPTTSNMIPQIYHRLHFLILGSLDGFETDIEQLIRASRGNRSPTTILRIRSRRDPGTWGSRPSQQCRAVQRQHHMLACDGEVESEAVSVI